MLFRFLPGQAISDANWKEWQQHYPMFPANVLHSTPSQLFNGLTQKDFSTVGGSHGIFGWNSRVRIQDPQVQGMLPGFKTNLPLTNGQGHDSIISSGHAHHFQQNMETGEFIGSYNPNNDPHKILPIQEELWRVPSPTKFHVEYLTYPIQCWQERSAARAIAGSFRAFPAVFAPNSVTLKVYGAKSFDRFCGHFLVPLMRDPVFRQIIRGVLTFDLFKAICFRMWMKPLPQNLLHLQDKVVGFTPVSQEEMEHNRATVPSVAEVGDVAIIPPPQINPIHAFFNNNVYQADFLDDVQPVAQPDPGPQLPLAPPFFAPKSKNHDIPNEDKMAASTTVGELLGVNKVVAQKDLSKKIDQWLKYLKMEGSFSKELGLFPQRKTDVETLLGIEVEVENIANPELNPPGWISEKDGSLRNDGREFKSVPLTHDQARVSIAALWMALRKLNQQKADFSWRTSIHVHVDVTRLTREELYKYLLVYSVFEPCLFEFAGRTRATSIYCTPLHATDWHNRIYQIRKSLTAAKHWKKYSALNLLHLFDYGTLEFRHFQGTDDGRKIWEWCNFILEMYAFSKRVSLPDLMAKILELNTSSKYQQFRDEVFQEWGKYLTIPDFQGLCSRGVRFAKECIIEPSETRAKTLSKSSDFAKSAASQFLAGEVSVTPPSIPRGKRTVPQFKINLENL